MMFVRHFKRPSNAFGCNRPVGTVPFDIFETHQQSFSHAGKDMTWGQGKSGDLQIGIGGKLDYTAINYYDVATAGTDF